MTHVPLHIARALRVHHWSKNLLVFLPLLLAHRVAEGIPLLRGLFAFFAFCLCASSVYVVNDLFDLWDDRHHPLKRHRPFASGALRPGTGLVLGGALLLAGTGLGLLPPRFTALLLLYWLAGVAYSAYLKRVLMVDVLLLAGLYTVRLLAGGAATDTPLSAWLLAFSLFFFLGLALLKRYVELGHRSQAPYETPWRRGYAVAHSNLVRATGVASGFLSVMVLVLYVSSDKVTALYAHPALLWLAGPLLLFWIARLWFLAQASTLRDDPILFAIKDPVSYVVAAIIAGLMVAAAL